MAGIISFDRRTCDSIMAKETAERLVWAVDVLTIERADRVLEIGCGPGVAVSLVCDKLDGGHITAIDRSEKMIALARKRNSSYIASGKALFQAAALNEVELEGQGFDKIFAVNVNLFWTHPGSGLSTIKALLAPGA
jgi:ubiquinone/menaquinone biosynthesis C-methylase UbiE